MQNRAQYKIQQTEGYYQTKQLFYIGHKRHGNTFYKESLLLFFRTYSYPLQAYKSPIYSNVVNSVPYRPVRPEYTVPASNPVRSTPLFRTGKNTGRTGQFRAIPVGTEKGFFFFFFLSFVIFEFLLGQNSNLFALTYQYYLFSQYAIITFELSILFFFPFNDIKV